MFLDHIILATGGLVFGAATASGVIALFTKLGVVPRMIARLQVGNHILPCECAIILGAVTGCVMSIFETVRATETVTPAMWQELLLIVVSLGAGIYVGCQAMALAEILNMFPILFRRAKLQVGLRAVMLALILGKVTGSLWYFIFDYRSLG